MRAPGVGDGLWTVCPACGRVMLLSWVRIPLCVAAGQMWADMREVRAALALHVRSCSP